MRIAIQGITGSFHHQAAQEFFGPDIELVECATFRAVFEVVKSGRAERGVVAIENSLHGSINPVYRLLAEQKLWVCGEVRLKIDLYLIGGAHACFHQPHHGLKDYVSTSEVLSQAEALSQCESWLDTHLPQANRVEMPDTAESVRYVVHQTAVSSLPAGEDPGYAAVAGKSAAKRYGGKILAGPINDDPNNYTRFFMLAKEEQPYASATRTSIVMSETSDSPGKLFRALSLFAKRAINLSKLDSHPLPGQARRYAFYIDIDKGLAELQPLFQQLRQDDWQLQILGSYQA
jgi:prephenate dehydratase